MSTRVSAYAEPELESWSHVAFTRKSLIVVRLKDVKGYEHVASYLDIGLQEKVSESGLRRCEILDPRNSAKLSSDGATVTGELLEWKTKPFHFYSNVSSEAELKTYQNHLGVPDIFFPGDDLNRNRLPSTDPQSSCKWTRTLDPKYEKCFSWSLFEPRKPDRFIMHVEFTRGSLHWKGLVAVRASYDPTQKSCTAWPLLCSQPSEDDQGRLHCAENGWDHQIHEFWAYPDTVGFASDKAKAIFRTIGETERNDLSSIVAEVSELIRDQNGELRPSDQRTRKTLSEKP